MTLLRLLLLNLYLIRLTLYCALATSSVISCLQEAADNTRPFNQAPIATELSALCAYVCVHMPIWFHVRISIGWVQIRTRNQVGISIQNLCSSTKRVRRKGGIDSKAESVFVLVLLACPRASQ